MRARSVITALVGFSCEAQNLVPNLSFGLLTPFYTCGRGDLEWSLSDCWEKRIWTALGHDRYWDSTIAGTPAPAGVHVWLIRVIGVHPIGDTFP